MMYINEDKILKMHLPALSVSRGVHFLNSKVPPEQACHSPSLTPLKRRLSSVTCTYLQEGIETATVIKMVATPVNTDVATYRNLVHKFIIFLKDECRIQHITEPPFTIQLFTIKSNFTF